MKKKLIKPSIFLVLLIIGVVFFTNGRREIATVHNPSDEGYYISVYQTGYMYTTHYRCVSILYGPDGEISREYFGAFSTDQLEPHYLIEGISIKIVWHDDYVSVSSADHCTSGITRNYYIDGHITSEECPWDVDW